MSGALGPLVVTDPESLANGDCVAQVRPLSSGKGILSVSDRLGLSENETSWLICVLDVSRIYKNKEMPKESHKNSNKF